MIKLSKDDQKYINQENISNSYGCLYIIATPIGNFEDISLRAIKLLGTVDILLCEDTRKTKNLLTYLNIKRKNLISYNDINGSEKRPYIINQLLSKKKIGIVSDAGTPLINDPGYKLVQDCYSHEIKITHAPGPSSVINGLILSGLPTNQFFFGGFVSSKERFKKKQFLLVKNYPMTGVWFDTCLRIQNTLKVMLEIFGNRNVSITRELTKSHEEIIFSDLNTVRQIIYDRENNGRPLKGEIVLIVDGHDKKKEILNYEELNIIIKNRLQNFSLRDAVDQISSENNLPKKLIYNLAIKIKNII